MIEKGKKKLNRNFGLAQNEVFLSKNGKKKAKKVEQKKKAVFGSW